MRCERQVKVVKQQIPTRDSLSFAEMNPCARSAVFTFVLPYCSWRAAWGSCSLQLEYVETRT